MTGSSDTGSRAALEPHDERDRAEEDRREDEKLPPPDPDPVDERDHGTVPLLEQVVLQHPVPHPIDTIPLASAAREP